MDENGIVTNIVAAMKTPEDEGYEPADTLEFPQWAVVGPLENSSFK